MVTSGPMTPTSRRCGCRCWGRRASSCGADWRDTRRRCRRSTPVSSSWRPLPASGRLEAPSRAWPGPCAVWSASGSYAAAVMTCLWSAVVCPSSAAASSTGSTLPSVRLTDSSMNGLRVDANAGLVDGRVGRRTLPLLLSSGRRDRVLDASGCAAVARLPSGWAPEPPLVQVRPPAGGLLSVAASAACPSTRPGPAGAAPCGLAHFASEMPSGLTAAAGRRD